MTYRTVILRTGAANLASVQAAFARLGEPVTLTEDPSVIAAAERLVLPGVGTFGAAMTHLARHRLADVLRSRTDEGKPLLAICLGMQLLCEASEESPEVRGLGVIPATVERFRAPTRSPHFGWNDVTPDSECRWIEPGAAYFANSFRLQSAPGGWNVARTNHGGPFISAIERGAILACQFHPELSGPWGLALIQRWLSQTPLTRALACDEGADGPARRVIPCLDVRDGRVVKGVRFSNLRDAGDPVARAVEYEAQGADELVMLDVSATDEGRIAALDTTRAIRAAISIPLTVGGGVRGVEHAAAMLEAGADKVAVNTAAVKNPAILAELSKQFGAQCTVIAIDAARRHDRPASMSSAGDRSASPSWQVVIGSGRERVELDAVDWARNATSMGAGEVLLTCWDRDGTRSGYDLNLIESVSRAVSAPVIASGGAATAAHLVEALRAGADAVLAASIFHDSHFTVGEIKRVLRAEGVEVRQ